MTHQIHRLAFAFVLAFSVMALTGGYWAVLEQETLLARPDNPRRLLLERRAPRGAISDRNGAVLAEVRGTPGDYARHYPYPALAPVLGYVSPLYGLAGVEAAEDSILHGDAGRDAFSRMWDELLGRPPAGRAVRLTLDLRLQEAADRALGDRTGALVLVDAVSGEILALASHPTFDPNTLDENWEALIADVRAPLLNRATSALYQPGGALQPFLLAAALQSEVAGLDTVFVRGGDPFTLNALTLTCRTDSRFSALILEEAFRLGCPQPFAALGRQLGARRMEQLVRDLRWLTAPEIGLPTLASAPPDFSSELAALGAGQGTLTLTPLHLALATASIARRGQLPAPQLILATQDANGVWRPATPDGASVAAFNPASAEQVKTLMRNGHAALAFTGTERQAFAWFTAFAPYDAPRYALAVLLEDGDVEAAEQIGLSLLRTAQVTP